MPSPSAVFSEIVATTNRNHPGLVVDNVSKNNALLSRMKERGNIKTKSGGYEIVLPLEWSENTTYQRYSGLDTQNVAASDVITAAKYDWCQAAINVVASGRELRMNNGKEQIIDLAKAKIKNAMNTAANSMSVDLYSDGALSNQIGGLAHIIQNDGAGTVGGIASGTYTFWKNKFQEMTGTNTYASIKQDMNKLFYATTRGADMTDLIVFSHDIYAAYEDSLQTQQRWADAKQAAAGFEFLKYKSADVILDDNTNFGTTSETGYFLNTKYLYMIQHSEAQWTQDDERKPVNQDGVVIPMYWMGQLVCSNRALQGKLIDAA